MHKQYPISRQIRALCSGSLAAIALLSLAGTAHAGTFTSISVGSHVCAIVDGGAKCWGNGIEGQLGNGANSNSNIPLDVTGLSSGVTTISVDGGVNACAIVNGGAKCWGRGSAEESLGNGAHNDSNVPVDVTGLATGVTAISTGGSNACAVVGGAVKCWGYGIGGGLGNGGNTNSDVPVDVTGLSSGATAVAVGGATSCAIVSGAAKCWGNGIEGELGNGGNSDSNVPVDVTGLSSGVTAISESGLHTCAIVGGAAKCWGYGLEGDLGNGGDSDSNVPVDVSGLSSGVTAISAGGGTTCAIVNGGAKCWGRGDFGQLGNGGNSNSNVPVDVTGLSSGVTAIGVDEFRACAIVSGTAKCWGVGTDGSLGNGGNSNSNVPVDVVGGPLPPGGGGGTPPLPPAPVDPPVTLGPAGKAKVKGKKVFFTPKLTLAIPPGFSAGQACTGDVVSSTKPAGLKKAAKDSSPLGVTGSSCTANFKLSLPKKFKNKTIKIKLTFVGNAAFQKFTKTVSMKVK